MAARPETSAYLWHVLWNTQDLLVEMGGESPAPVNALPSTAPFRPSSEETILDDLSGTLSSQTPSEEENFLWLEDSGGAAEGGQIANVTSSQWATAGLEKQGPREGPGRSPWS